MQIAMRHTAETCDVTLSGTFTFSDSTAFRDVLAQIGEPKVQRVVLHMAKVEFVDSAALGMLLLANDEAAKYQKSLIINGPTGQVRKMFDLARFNTLFTIS
ncbi:MAG: STAS domain-containing protein [Pseudomonadota bacterium]|nr:STAS domain-containing protein [Pseudomonadota bacterium]